VIYQVGDKQWGPYDSAGHRTQYMCSMTSSSTAGWVAIQSVSPVGGSCQTYGEEQSRDDGYLYWCGRDEKTGKLLWTSTKPPAQDPGATPSTDEPSPGSANHSAAR